MAKMQSDYENIGVFEDFHFVTLVVILYYLITCRLQTRLENRALRCSKTVSKHYSKSVASWKRFWDVWNDFGVPNGSQKRSLRRPRGIKKRLLFSLASQDVSRMDFGPHLDPLGLDFEQFLE